MSTQAGRVTSNVRDFLESQLEDRAKGVTLIVEEPGRGEEEEDPNLTRVVVSVTIAFMPVATKERGTKKKTDFWKRV